MSDVADLQDGTQGSPLGPLDRRYTSVPPPARVGFGSTTSTPKTRTIIPWVPGGTNFRRALAWLGLSLPIWLAGVVAVSPVSLSCTTVSVPAGYDRGFAQLAVVCWATLRDPAPPTSEHSDGSTSRSVPPSSGSWPMGTVIPSEASWAWGEVVGR